MIRCATQWRVGMDGPVGLDYGVVFRFMDRLALDGEAWDALIDDVRVMESEALRVMREAAND